MILLHRDQPKFGAGGLFLRRVTAGPGQGACQRSGCEGRGAQPTEASRGRPDSPDGQHAGRGFTSDPQIPAVWGLVLPRRNVPGADHHRSALAGEECHTPRDAGTL